MADQKPQCVGTRQRPLDRVPGAVRLIDLEHRENGRLPCGRPLQPAIQLATTAFRLGRSPPRSRAAAPGLLDDAEATRPTQATRPRRRSARRGAPELGRTLRRGGAAPTRSTPARAPGDRRPGAARPKSHRRRSPRKMRSPTCRLPGEKRDAVCTTYARMRMRMPPPSSGVRGGAGAGPGELQIGSTPPTALDTRAASRRCRRFTVARPAARLCRRQQYARHRLRAAEGCSPAAMLDRRT